MWPSSYLDRLLLMLWTAPPPARRCHGYVRYVLGLESQFALEGAAAVIYS
jgi:hypothetical protein